MVVAFATACGRLVGADEPAPSAVAADASSEAASPPADSGTSVVPDAEAPDAAPCQAGQLRCGAACVTSCSQCAGRPIECIACDQQQKNPIGTCEPTGTAYCLSGDYSTAYLGGPGEHCDCSSTEVARCPGATQVCEPHQSTDWCITCGEQNVPSTAGLPCKGGGTCNTAVTPPRCQ